MATTKAAAKPAPKPQGTTMNTGKARLSFVNIWEPKVARGSTEAKYSVSVLVPKSDTATKAKIDACIEAAKEVGKAKWGGKIPVNLKLVVHDGDNDAERGDRGDEYKGHWFFTASTKTKPGVVDANREEITNTTAVYSGCYGKVNINFYPYDSNGSKGVACGLNHVQFLEDGEPLGGRGSAADAFADDEDSDALLQ